MNFTDIWHQASQIDGWLTRREGLLLYSLAKELGGTIVEIGSYKGRSTMCLAGAGKSCWMKIHVYAIDPHKGQISQENTKKSLTVKTYAEFMNNIRKNKLQKTVSPLVCTSKSASKEWKLPIELLFIDGLHDYKNTRQDFELFSGFVKNGGIIAFHDAYCGHVGAGALVFEIASRIGSFSGIGAVGSIIYLEKGSPDGLLARLIYKIRYNILKIGHRSFQISAIPYAFRLFLSHRIIKALLWNKFDKMMSNQKQC